ncbi:MAG: hypothetical protein IT356_04365 [Gemmatimonadaceae bacterium]|nr:hypothetical protein [Gemmatimonadaceae bacterium]
MSGTATRYEAPSACTKDSAFVTTEYGVDCKPERSGIPSPGVARFDCLAAGRYDRLTIYLDKKLVANSRWASSISEPKQVAECEAYKVDSLGRRAGCAKTVTRIVYVSKVLRGTLVVVALK